VCAALVLLTNPALADTSLEAAIDTTTPQLLRQFSVPGAAVALIRKGEVVWMRGYGFADVATARRVTPDTLFNVGSISKTATAWGVMRLVETGKLGLDQPVDSYLSRWHVPASNFDAQQVTARRLLSHTAGISAHGYGGSDPARPLSTVEDSLTGKTGTGAVQLTAAPGAGHNYSGANYRILELAIEEISGQPFQAWMRTEIFARLGMKSTRFDLPAPDGPALATPYDGFSKPLPALRYQDLSAAGLSSSLRDLAGFTAAALPDARHRKRAGRGVLQPATLAQMATPAPNSRWIDRDPFGPMPQYGLGYTVRPAQFAGMTGIGHGGSNSGWESLIQAIPATGDGIVIMTNSSNGSALIAALLCEWRRSAAAAAAAAECPTIAVKIPMLAAYDGGGIEPAIALYRKMRVAAVDSYDWSVPQLNSLGYLLMRAGDVPGAVRIFQLNAETYPREWNVFDSLGEAYARAGDKARAVEAYRRSVALNPHNDNGREALRQLGAPP